MTESSTPRTVNMLEWLQAMMEPFRHDADKCYEFVMEHLPDFAATLEAEIERQKRALSEGSSAEQAAGEIRRDLDARLARAEDVIRQIHALASSGWDSDGDPNDGWTACGDVSTLALAYLTDTKIEPMWPPREWRDQTIAWCDLSSKLTGFDGGSETEYREALRAKIAADGTYAVTLRKFIEARPCPNPQCSDGSIVNTGPDPQNDACEWCYVRHMVLGRDVRATYIDERMREALARRPK